MIDSIVGFCTLPVGIIILLKEWGLADFSRFLPFDLLWIGSLCIIAV